MDLRCKPRQYSMILYLLINELKFRVKFLNVIRKKMNGNNMPPIILSSTIQPGLAVLCQIHRLVQSS